MPTRRAALTLPLLLPGLARAQGAWANRPVQLIVPWAAGGGTDTVARILAQGLQAEIGQPVNVVNRTGGAGITGHSAIATAAPDGYTLGIGTSEFATFRTMGQSELGPQDFDLLSRVALLPAGVTVAGNAPWANFPAFAAALKESRKGQLTGSGVGPGGSWHLACAGMCRALGLPADHVRWIPSTGGAPALQDLVAGGLSLFTGSPVEAQSLASAGRVKVLAVMADTRMASFPEVPTLRQAGLDWAYQNWFALIAPKGLPAETRTAILAAAGRAHARPEVREQMLSRSIVPIWESPAQFAAFVAQFGETTGTLLRELGLAKS